MLFLFVFLTHSWEHYNLAPKLSFCCLAFHLQELTQYQAKCQELQATELNLRSQISLYTDKYDEFQKALTMSNELLGGFKGEMEKVS
jgi:cell division protein FtsB